MSLIQDIKANNLEARKQKLTAVSYLLTTLIGEAEMIGKNDGGRETTDAEVQALVRKFIKNNVDFVGALGDDHPRTAVLLAENFTLGKYLPKQLSEQELKAAISHIIHDDLAGITPKMGDVMKMLKERCDGLYDGKLASQLIKAELA